MKLENTTRDQPGHFQVEFLHRTVRDFLFQEYRDELQTKAGTDFDARLSLCQVKLLELKKAEQDYDGSYHSTHVMTLLHYTWLNLSRIEVPKRWLICCMNWKGSGVMTRLSRLYRVYHSLNRLAPNQASFPRSPLLRSSRTS